MAQGYFMLDLQMGRSAPFKMSRILYVRTAWTLGRAFSFSELQRCHRSDYRIGGLASNKEDAGDVREHGSACEPLCSRRTIAGNTCPENKRGCPFSSTAFVISRAPPIYRNLGKEVNLLVPRILGVEQADCIEIQEVHSKSI